MQELLKELMEDGEKAIDSWIERRVKEDLNFDCKLKHDAKTPKLGNSERKHLGKVISAFSNSDGGLLLWGVNARLSEGVDCVIGKSAIAEITVFRSQVEQVVSEVISPPIAGIRFFEVKSQQSPGSGYLAIVVPASERRPHISKTNDFPGFFFRNGHQSLIMEVFQIRDQMLRETVPRLELEWKTRVLASEISFNDRTKSKVPLSIDLIFINKSSVSARFPFLIFEFDRSLYIELGDNHNELARSCPRLRPLGSVSRTQRISNPAQLVDVWEFAGGADYCVHPGMSMPFLSIQINAPATRNSHLDDNLRVQTEYLSPQYDLLPKVIFNVSFGCLNSPSEMRRFEITASQILSNLIETGQCGDVVLTSGSATISK